MIYDMMHLVQYIFMNNLSTNWLLYHNLRPIINNMMQRIGG